MSGKKTKKGVAYSDGCVISMVRLCNGKYESQNIRLEGEVTEKTVKSIRDFIFSNSNAIMANPVSGEKCGTICDMKSFGKNGIPNKSAKLKTFAADWGESKAAREEDESDLEEEQE